MLVQPFLREFGPPYGGPLDFPGGPLTPTCCARFAGVDTSGSTFDRPRLDLCFSSFVFALGEISPRRNSDSTLSPMDVSYRDCCLACGEEIGALVSQSADCPFLFRRERHAARSSRGVGDDDDALRTVAAEVRMRVCGTAAAATTTVKATGSAVRRIGTRDAIGCAGPSARATARTGR